MCFHAQASAVVIEGGDYRKLAIGSWQLAIVSRVQSVAQQTLLLIAAGWYDLA
jgi:hypothetical protein